CDCSSQAPSTAPERTPASAPGGVAECGGESLTIGCGARRGVVRCACGWETSLGSDLEHELAEVLAAEELEQGVGEAVEAAHDVLAALQAPVLEVAGELGHGLREARRV